jgi:hypothetical protein
VSFTEDIHSCVSEKYIMCVVIKKFRIFPAECSGPPHLLGPQGRVRGELGYSGLNKLAKPPHLPGFKSLNTQGYMP